MSELTILSGSLVSPPEPARQGPAEITIESDADFFERRASGELAYAASLSNPRCRALHVELASRYGQLAAALREAAIRVN